MREETKFRIAVITFPLWVLPAMLVGFIWLCGWLLWSLGSFALLAAFAIAGKGEWSDRVAKRTGWEDDGSW